VKHKALILTAIAMFCLSACTGIQRGTETDNTDIMVPDTVQKFTDKAHALDFFFGIDWERDDDLTFTKGDSYVATTITEGITVALAEHAGEGFVGVEGTDLETVSRSRPIEGGIIEERYSLRDSTVVYFYAVLVAEEAEADFPVTVKNSDVVVDVTVCVGRCGGEVEVLGNADEPLVLYGGGSGTTESNTVELDPSAMPRVNVPEYQLPESSADENDDESEASSSGAMLEARPNDNTPTMEIQP
jgi:hypothetical protein